MKKVKNNAMCVLVVYENAKFRDLEMQVLMGRTCGGLLFRVFPTRVTLVLEVYFT